MILDRDTSDVCKAPEAKGSIVHLRGGGEFAKCGRLFFPGNPRDFYRGEIPADLSRYMGFIPVPVQISLPRSRPHSSRGNIEFPLPPKHRHGKQS